MTLPRITGLRPGQATLVRQKLRLLELLRRLHGREARDTDTFQSYSDLIR